MICTPRALAGCLVAVALAASFAACSQRNATASVAPTASVTAIPSGPGPNPRQADLEYVEICKDYSGTPGPAVTFTVAVDVDDNGSVDQTFQVSVAGGQCMDVWQRTAIGHDTLTVTETVPSGYTASWVLSNNANGTITTNPSVSGNVATGAKAAGLGDSGSLIIFTNTLAPPPPPPPGLQGCTPGYWKQDQHLNSWPAPYTANTQFSAVFENAFPGLTLDQVLGLGGGGLNALGRHTVAALLNAASGSVNYGMTPAEVIAAFNAVFPGGDYEGQKNIFAAANERTCPLN